MECTQEIYGMSHAVWVGGVGTERRKEKAFSSAQHSCTAPLFIRCQQEVGCNWFDFEKY